MDYVEHHMLCNATQISRFRNTFGKDGLVLLLKANIGTPEAIETVKAQVLERLIVVATVPEKAISHSVDSRLLEIVRHKVTSAAKHAHLQIKHSFTNEKKALRWKVRCMHPCQTVPSPASLAQTPTLHQGHCTTSSLPALGLGYRALGLDSRLAAETLI